MIPRQPATLVFLVYDGVDNPVFESQVIFLLRTQQTLYSRIILITFEYNPHPALATQLAHTYPFITWHVCTKHRFWGAWSLGNAQKQLLKILSLLDQPYHVIARGPLAGYIAIKAIASTLCSRITIQARGLLGAEYEYTHRLHTHSSITTWPHRLRLKLYTSLETAVYTSITTTKIPCYIEAVSPALRDHLVTTYNLAPERLYVATLDVPQPLSPEQRATWRTAIRARLGITETPRVYCYNGSAKPWQCPELTIQLFKHHLQHDPNSFLLVITQDIAFFKAILEQEQVAPSCYTLVSLAHADVIRYLAACDVGILLREQHLMNWISRPTKALEYQAAGLSIAHNGTVASLTFQSE